MKYANIIWRDGHPYSPDFEDIYFSSEGAREESSYVFVQQNGLPEKWRGKKSFLIAETGFGTGLNFVLTLKAWLETADESACLHYLAIEKHPVSPEDISQLSETWPDLAEYFGAMLAVYPLPVEGSHPRSLYHGRVRIYFEFMDVQQALRDRCLGVDCWYLDGFGPSKNPGLWSRQVLLLIAQNSAQAAGLATFTCAGDVRRGLQAAGFEVSKVAGYGRKREMITARMSRLPAYRSAAPWYEIAPCHAPDKTAIVIGAGIAGLTAAWSLVQRGWSVRLLDKHESVAQEASGNPAGLVLPRISIADANDACFYSSALLFAQNRLDELQQASKHGFWFRDGVISIYARDRAKSAIARYEYPEAYMSLPDARHRPAYIDPGLTGLACFPASGWVAPAALCRQLVKACGDNLTFRTAAVTTLEKKDTDWIVLDQNRETLARANVAVIACGAGLKTVEQTAFLPVDSVRGQLTLVDASDSSASLRQAISADVYVTPAIDGMHCTGATFSRANRSTDLLRTDQDENLDRLQAMLPGMFARPAGLQGRVGFRAVSRDRAPIVGAVPDVAAFEQQYAGLHHGRTNVVYEDGKYREGLYVSAAHGSRGLCSSFLAAEIIASMVENTALPVARPIINYLSPARFLVRQLRRCRKRPG